MTEKWIDVSAHNGVIDWSQVAASGVQGAVIRAGYGNDVSQTDRQFENNICGAVAAGLKVAIYWFGYADSVADALKEWAICKKVIEPYRGSILFVCYDYEYDSVNYYQRIHGTAPSKTLINTTVTAFLNAAKSDGWKTCLYTNNDYRLHVFSASTLETPDYLWLADYSGGPDIPCAIQQTGSDGRIPGIVGNVDMDTVFIPIGVPEFKCDTTMDVTRAPGGWYQFKVTSDKNPKVNVGSDGVATILPRYQLGSDYFYYIVAYGNPGAETGVYVNDVLQFKFKIK